MTNFEKNMKRYMKNQDSLMQTIQRLEVQMSQLATLQNERQKGTLPSQPIMNPKNSQQAHLTEDQSMNQCNTVHTLRSGNKVDNTVSTPSNPIQHNHTQPSTSSNPSPSESDKIETDKSTSQVHQPIVSFPNRLKNNKQNSHMNKIIEIFHLLSH